MRYPDESSTDPTSDPAPTPQNEPVAAIVARSSSEAVLFAQPSSKSENAEDGSSFAGIPPGVFSRNNCHSAMQ